MNIDIELTFVLVPIWAAMAGLAWTVGVAIACALIDEVTK